MFFQPLGSPLDYLLLDQQTPTVFSRISDDHIDLPNAPHEHDNISYLRRIELKQCGNDLPSQVVVYIKEPDFLCTEECIDFLCPISMIVDIIAEKIKVILEKGETYMQTTFLLGRLSRSF
jgi:hypothetical protein